MIFKFLKARPFSKKLDAELAEDIPRYPPFAKGLPAASSKCIIETQLELIDKIRVTLAFNRDQFDEIALPVIERYADFVHLMPASENHHHRGAGGLFRHGLEVALWTAQAADAHQFGVQDTPSQRRANGPRWQFAAFIGGLLHDVGKPLSDIQIIDATGKKEWNPYEVSVSGWLEKNGIERYFIRWRDQRKRRHTKFSMLNIDQIITSEARAYLNEPGPTIMEALLESIVGTQINDTLPKLVLKADQESVKRDLVNQRIEVDEQAYGVPVERFVFDALRRLISTKTFKVNVPGAIVWRLHSGVYIAWQQAAPAIHKILQEDNVPGIPKSPETLADILRERGFVTDCDLTENTEGLRYWKIYPEPLRGIPLSCIRIEEIEHVFTGEPPVPIRGGLNEPLPEHRKDENAKNESETINSGKAAGKPNPVESASSNAPPAPKQQPVDISTVDREIPPIIEEPLMPQDYAQYADMEQQGEELSEPAFYEDSSYIPEDDAPVQVQQGNISRKPQGKPKTNGSPQLNKLANIAAGVNADIKVQPKKAPSKPVADNSIRITATDTPGMSLVYQALAKNKKGKIIIEKLGAHEFGVHYPDKVSSLGDPREIMKLWADEGILKPGVGGAKTISQGSRKYLVFNLKVSTYLKAELVDEQALNAPPRQQEKKQPIKPDQVPSSVEEVVEVPKFATDPKPEQAPVKKKASKKKAQQKKKEAPGELNKFEKERMRKLISQDEFNNQIKVQLEQGKGGFISGEVEEVEFKGKPAYKISITSIQTTSKQLNTVKAIAKTMINKVPGSKILESQEKIVFLKEA